MLYICVFMRHDFRERNIKVEDCLLNYKTIGWRSFSATLVYHCFISFN